MILLDFFRRTKGLCHTIMFRLVSNCEKILFRSVPYLAQQHIANIGHAEYGPGLRNAIMRFIGRLSMHRTAHAHFEGSDLSSAGNVFSVSR